MRAKKKGGSQVMRPSPSSQVSSWHSNFNQICISIGSMHNKLVTILSRIVYSRNAHLLTGYNSKKQWWDKKRLGIGLHNKERKVCLHLHLFSHFLSFSCKLTSSSKDQNAEQKEIIIITMVIMTMWCFCEMVIRGRDLIWLSLIHMPSLSECCIFEKSHDRTRTYTQLSFQSGGGRSYF